MRNCYEYYKGNLLQLLLNTNYNNNITNLTIWSLEKKKRFMLNSFWPLGYWILVKRLCVRIRFNSHLLRIIWFFLNTHWISAAAAASKELNVALHWAWMKSVSMRVMSAIGFFFSLLLSSDAYNVTFQAANEKKNTHISRRESNSHFEMRSWGILRRGG